jgi:hypothetical protein
VIVTDALNASVTQNVTIAQPAQINTALTQTACKRFVFNGNTITASGTYKDTLTSSKGCDSILTMALTVNTVNTAVSQSGATLTSGQGGATYKWVYCDSNYKAVPGATNQVFTATKNGRYALIVTLNNCTDTSACRQVTTVGIDELSGDKGYSLYPNPADDKVTLEVTRTLLQKTWQLTDGLGRIVLSGTLGHTTSTISLKALPAGLYMLRIDGHSEAIKVTKQ